MHARVVLPPGYSAGARRYPVIYFLHGLPATSVSYSALRWVASALAATGRPAILVAPQGARDDDTDAEYLDWGEGRNWETYVSSELVRVVDSRLQDDCRPPRPGDYRRICRRLRRRGDRLQSPRQVRGDRVVVRLLRADRSRRAREARPRLAGRERAGEPPHARHDLGARGSRRATPSSRSTSATMTRVSWPRHVPARPRAEGGAHRACLRGVRGRRHTTALWERHAVGWLRLALAHLAPATP